MRIVLVSSFAVERQALKELLEGDGHEIRIAETRDQGIEAALRWNPDAMIADVRVGAEGPALIAELAARGAHPRVFVLCARAECMGSEPADYFTKPIDLDRLCGRLHAPARVA